MLLRKKTMSQVSVSKASRNLSHWINRASYGREVVVVTSRGKPKAVILGVEAFEELVGLHDFADLELMPLEQFRTEFRQALAESGYQSRDDMIELVREVKQELAAEQAAETESREPASE